ncbi:hypothetical protein FOA52_011863 [Chlamydomonas sp. UWO 241]|nr:hypothetical protein FOA52_011863 [Chlamydomonas sp. UWO 241]
MVEAVTAAVELYTAERSGSGGSGGSKGGGGNAEFSARGGRKGASGVGGSAEWRALQQRCMAEDFSWGSSAAQYERLFRELRVAAAARK